MFERKGSFDPNEIKFKVGFCFKAEIKTLDLIIDSKFSGPSPLSAEARGKIPVEGRRMFAPTDRHISLESYSYLNYKLFGGSFCVFGVYTWMTVDHKLLKHVLLQLPPKTVYAYCLRSKPEPVSKIFLIYFNRLGV